MFDDNHCYLVTTLHGCPWAHNDLPPSPVSDNGFPDSYTSQHATDLYECIERRGSFPENQARYIFNQILDAVSHLHSLNLVHRDIKDENILIDQDYQIKLIDFGAVSTFDPSKDTHFNSFFGTLQYAAPEILSNSPYSGPKAEIWSLGCCLYIMLTGNIPFTNTEHASSLPFTTPSISLSSSCLHLLHGMLHKDPKKRASLDDVMMHPWTNY
jgi:serine/threonine protein kinase